MQREASGKTKYGRLLGEAGDKDRPRARDEGIRNIEISQDKQCIAQVGKNLGREARIPGLL